MTCLVIVRISNAKKHYLVASGEYLSIISNTRSASDVQVDGVLMMKKLLLELAPKTPEPERKSHKEPQIGQIEKNENKK